MTGTTKDHARPGQPYVTTLAHDHHILLMHLCNHFQTATQTEVNTYGTQGFVSANTVNQNSLLWLVKQVLTFVLSLLTAEQTD